MRSAIVIAMLLVNGSAQAKLTVLDSEPTIPAISVEDTTIGSGPAGALLESTYYNAPQSPVAGVRVFPCSLQDTLFQKTRLLRICE